MAYRVLDLSPLEDGVFIESFSANVRKLDFSQILDYQVPSTLGFLSNS
jgi:hypothetical protein